MKELLFELGTEEIPSRLLRGAERALGAAVAARLDDLGLEHSAVRTYSTPRRLALAVDVAPRQADRVEERVGPPARVAWDADGNPTRAAEHFAKRNGVAVDALERRETPKGLYAAVTVQIDGQTTASLLPDVLTQAVTGLTWPKVMRWHDGTHAFIRPVHWLVALYDGEVLPLTLYGVRAGRETRGHRFLAPAPFAVADEAAWLEGLRAAKVEPDAQVRAQRILDGAHALAAQVGAALVRPEGLIEEVTGLCEWPRPLLGTFDEAALEIPPQVLVDAMRVHQKYFALATPETAQTQRPTLRNHFVVVAATEAVDDAVVAQGNARVLAARLADARFFFEADRARTLDSLVDELGQRTFLQGLGTVADKAHRLEALTPRLAARLYGDAVDAAEAAAAGLYAKADLSTEMVGEFPDLQGEMGRDYARLAGQPEAVAAAIEEHYWPRFAGDAAPSTPLGAAASLADKLDSLVGCFALGLEPTGSADPYALRRQALGVVRVLEALPAGPGGAAPKRLGLTEALDIAREVYGAVLDAHEEAHGDWPAVRARLLGFFRGRMKNDLARDLPTDLVEAALSAGFDDPVDARGRLTALAARKDTDGWDDLAAAVKRVVRIVTGQETGTLDDPGALTTPQERALHEATEAVERDALGAMEAGRYGEALERLASLKPTIDDFFDHVMVLSDDPDERRRRLALLGRIAALFGRVAAFDRIST